MGSGEVGRGGFGGGFEPEEGVGDKVCGEVLDGDFLVGI